MKIFMKYLLYPLAAILLVSCVDDRTQPITPGPQLMPKGDVRYGLRIVKFQPYVNDDGDDSVENFTVMNFGLNTVDLTGWKVVDPEAKKSTVWELNGKLIPHVEKVFVSDTLASFSNSGSDDIALVAPNGDTVQYYIYEKPMKGQMIVLPTESQLLQ